MKRQSTRPEPSLQTQARRSITLLLSLVAAICAVLLTVISSVVPLSLLIMAIVALRVSL
jgi:hypothetical protein